MLESDKGGKGEELAMEEAVRAQWSRESDRDAVLKKLRDCGLRSYLGLVKCIVSPTWHARIPRSCRLRGIPTLINVLISDKIKGAKLLRSQSLRSLVAMGTLALNTKSFLVSCRPARFVLMDVVDETRKLRDRDKWRAKDMPSD